MGTKYSQYRREKLAEGERYQDFVMEQLFTKLGLPVMQYVSGDAQRRKGESRNGLEIKFQAMYAKTGNLWIEVAEKAEPRPGPYVQSGIYRGDNSWLLVTGDYRTIFLLSINLLRQFAKSGRYRIVENKTRTSRGFLLSDGEARRYADKVLSADSEGNIETSGENVAELTHILHAAAQANPHQRTLFDKFSR